MTGVYVPEGGGAAEATGSIKPHAAAAGPVGFLKCNGAAVSRTTYAALFAAIGTVYGVGDGLTTFNIPDLRAEFIRGADDGAGVDSGRVFGSWQDEDTKAHSHTPGTASIRMTENGFGASWAWQGPGGATGSGGTPATIPSGGPETRPRNVAMHYWIKF